MTAVPPIRREVIVDASPEDAFRVFTNHIGSWWPLGDHSVRGDTGSVSFDNGQIVEVAANGERFVWGTVVSWQPALEVGFTWHPGSDADRASRVTVTFRAADSSTLVTLVHEGWEVFADPAGARDEYDHGWPMVLDRYAASAKAA